MSRKQRQPRFSGSKQKGPDLEKHENIIGLARMLARKQLPYMYKGLNSLTLLVSDKAAPYGQPTFMVDQYFRVYCHPEAIDKYVQMAKDVSTENPCETCGATSHANLAYIAGILVHELWHPLRKHSARAKRIDEFYPLIWNIATDLEINDDLVESLGLKKVCCIPPGVQLPKMYEFDDGKLAEEYYHKLIEEAEKSASAAGGEGEGLEEKLKDLADKLQQQCGSGCTGEPEDWEEGEPNPNKGNAPGLTKAEGNLLEKEIAKDIKKHEKSNPGTMSADMVRWANEMLAPPSYDWRRELQKMVRFSANMGRGDTYRSYRRLSRLSSVLDGAAILPASYQPLPKISVVVDTSGSMNDLFLKQAMSETDAVCKTIGTPVDIIECDYDSGKVQQAQGGVRKVVLHGGGGTDMSNGIRTAEASKPKPNVVIVMTDGETPWPEIPDRTIRYITCLVGNRVNDHIVNAVPDWIQVVRVAPLEE